jgi:lipid-binding SYLF domain-containing protein
MKTKLLALSTALAMTVLMGACSTTNPNMPTDAVATRQSMTADVDGALNKLRSQMTGSDELLRNARGVLVFPKVLSAGFVVGGSYGKGELRVRGQNAGYYSTTAASVGLLAGADSKAVYILFMTDEALKKFQDSRGWTVGADASVSVYKAGANLGIDTQTAQQPIIGYALTNSGLMANVSFDGTKISSLDM